MLYLIIVAATMLVLPLLSIGAENALRGGDLLALTLKWFVFWGVGIRLMIAGLRQQLRPELTRQGILGIADPKADVLVRELGGGNLGAGVIGLLSLWLPSFMLPAAIWGRDLLRLRRDRAYPGGDADEGIGRRTGQRPRHRRSARNRRRRRVGANLTDDIAAARSELRARPAGMYSLPASAA